MIYIALLRGINVGGKNMIKMPDLKSALEKMGLKNVLTYIQSGNVLFESEDKKDLLQQKIELGIQNTFGFRIPVVLRTTAAWEKLIFRNPFSEEEIARAATNSENKVFYAALFSRPLTEQETAMLSASCSKKEVSRVIGGDVYLLFDKSIRNSKLSGSIQKINAVSTTRNWETIQKIYALAKEKYTR